MIKITDLQATTAVSLAFNKSKDGSNESGKIYGSERMVVLFSRHQNDGVDIIAWCEQSSGNGVLNE